MRAREFMDPAICFSWNKRGDERISPHDGQMRAKKVDKKRKGFPTSYTKQGSNLFFLHMVSCKYLDM